jgi:NAD+ kinase
MTDIALEDKTETLTAMLRGEFTAEDRSLLEAKIERDGKLVVRALALNDVVVSRGVIGGMIELNVQIDGRFVYNQRSDGLIIATPTGSTAYALSASGPILHPNVEAFVLVPVSPHALTNRPIAVSDRSTVEIVLTRGRDAGAHFDGQSHFILNDGDKIIVRRSDYMIRILHPLNYDYYAMLRQKLHWSEIP